MRGYFSIWGYYDGKWEKIDEARDSDYALYLANEYRMAYGRDWAIEVRHHGKKFEY